MAKGNRRRRRPAGGGSEQPAAPSRSGPVEPEPEVESGVAASFDRTDLLCAAGATVVAAALFLTTFSTHVALGDAPESVAGAKTFGVLHAPGYPSYVAAAGIFGHIVAIGSWAARVNGFSLLCAAFTVGVVFLLARAFGASRVGAALGASVLATTASFWFNADFAKHFAFSGLLVTLAALMATRWQATGRTAWLIVAGALLGVCAGASWELAVIMAAGIAVLVAFGERRVRVGGAVGSVAALVVLAAGTCGFMMWRASQHPAVNWGEVDNVHRLLRQFTQQDFRSTNGNLSNHAVSELAIRLRGYIGAIVRDLGLGAIVVGIAGFVVAWRRLGWDRRLWILVVVVADLVLVVIASEVSVLPKGLPTATGGYLIDLFVGMSIAVAVGAEPLIELASDLAFRATTPARERARRRTRAGGYRTTVVAVIVVIAIVPSLIFHFGPADHRQPALADNYATRVLSELPHGAVLFIDQADDAFPIVYRQSVFGDRPDVSVVVVTSIQFAWYRDQITRELHLRTRIPTRSPVQHLIAELAPRPSFLDPGMIFLYRGEFKVKLRGLVGEVVSSTADETIDRDALSKQLLANDKADGFAGHAHIGFPNTFMYYFYARAHIELAKLYARAGQLPRARTEIARSLDDYPDANTRLALQFAGQKSEKRSKVVAVVEAL
ncbi:MAG TPA: DUF2723 domain-containing protein [Acidimicrobiia bacterium]|nr:DUF2723 domain-containing protein [Acidimicrobiia bacterium]